MHELLIRAKDKLPLVATAHQAASHRGDVVAIQHEGWQWSEYERNGGEWIVVRAKLKAEDIYSLTVGNRPGEPARKRRQKINIDGLKSGATLSRVALLAKVI